MAEDKGMLTVGHFDILETFSPQIKMLPTPAKFHYIFNLRDLSRIWEGMLHVAAADCKNVTDLLGLWCHECTRVIADRFTNAADCQWFDKVSEKNPAVS